MKKKFAIIAAIFSLMLSSANAKPVYIQEAPPLPIKETFQPKPGHIWSAGHYVWSGKAKAYQWKPGRFLAVRKGYVWTPDRWMKTKDGWYLNKGKWMTQKDFIASRNMKKGPAAVSSCGVRKGYKIGYRRSQYRDYDFGKK